jgi:NAD(P)-dependent dehydrogenase (short-subunit alcohol dehydrogenase family)
MDSQVFLLVGGFGGIGAALARRLEARGARVVSVSRRNGVDATSPEAVEGAVQQVIAQHGRLDGAVNLVGSILLKPAHLTTPDDFQTTLALNLTTAFNLVRSAAKAMIPTGGAIVLISTAAARTGIPNHEAIAAAKGGVLALTLSAAATYARYNIRVNCVAPGLVDSPLAARITASDAARKASAAMHPLGRIGHPDDVAAAIEWLLDPHNTWTTGQVIGVDGGLASLRAQTR